MSRYTIIAVIAALCLATANGLATTTQAASLTTASLAAPPAKVFDATTLTADANWNTYTKVLFGPAATNASVYAYGFLTGGTTYTVASRTINATLASNGTADTSGFSVSSTTDATASPTVTVVGTATQAVGLGSAAYVYVAADTDGCNQVYVAVYNGGTSGAVSTTKISTNVCVKCYYTDSTTKADGVRHDVTLGNAFYDNGTFFVAYTNKASTYTSATGDTTNCPATAAAGIIPVSTLTFASVAIKVLYQGVTTASTAALAFTTAPTLYSSTTAAQYALVTTTCGPSNYTNSTTHYCVYKDAAAGGTANLKLVKVTVSGGTADSGTTIATDSATGGTFTYTLAGFGYSLYQQGVFINNATTPTAGTLTNYLHFYNLTTGATAVTGGVAISGYTNTYASGAYSASAITYGTGYAILNSYPSSATANAYQYAAYFANGTLNTTANSAIVGAGSTGAAATGNWFTDANGALWIGAYSTDATAATVGYVGKVVAQLYTSGQALVSFFALLSVMIAAVFAF